MKGVSKGSAYSHLTLLRVKEAILSRFAVVSTSECNESCRSNVLCVGFNINQFNGLLTCSLIKLDNIENSGADQTIAQALVSNELFHTCKYYTSAL